MEYKKLIISNCNFSAFFKIYLVLCTVTIVKCLKTGLVHHHRSLMLVNVNPEALNLNGIPEICTTLKAEGSGLPQEGESPYEVAAQRVAPSVFEVIIQGKSGQLFTDFILSVEPPNRGEFSQDNFETHSCDADDLDRRTLIRSKDHKIPKRQVVAHFYPRKGKGFVRFRGSVYSNETTFWSIENNNLRLPVGH